MLFCCANTALPFLTIFLIKKNEPEERCRLILSVLVIDSTDKLFLSIFTGVYEICLANAFSTAGPKTKNILTGCFHATPKKRGKISAKAEYCSRLLSLRTLPTSYLTSMLCAETWLFFVIFTMAALARVRFAEVRTAARQSLSTRKKARRAVCALSIQRNQSSFFSATVIPSTSNCSGSTADGHSVIGSVASFSFG